MRKILFLDRDGTLIEEPSDHQIDHADKFSLVGDVIPVLLRFKNSGFEFVMVSNQDGLGSSQYPRASYDSMQRLLLQILQSQGLKFQEILICPHLPAENCSCRKPQTELVRHYLSSNDLDRENSYVIGDRATDLQLAQNMGLQGFLLNEDLGWNDIAHQLLDRPRTADLHRKTNETDIAIHVDLDAPGTAQVQSGIGFFDHMLEQLARHGSFNLKMKSVADLHIDEHHMVEDVALTLGAALKKALGDKRGITRYGFWLPMDEAETKVTLDLSGRSQFVLKANFPALQVGGLSVEMVRHFFKSLADGLAMSLHIETSGDNTHHMVESMFKAVGRSLAQAFQRTDSNPSAVPSTKGAL